MDLSPITFLVTLAGIQLLAAISPGPAFAVVTQKSLSGGRAAELAAAAGCTIGLGVWLAATMVGLTFLVSKFWWLYAALRVLGGVFLIYLAFQLWRHSRDPFFPDAAPADMDKKCARQFQSGPSRSAFKSKGACLLRKCSRNTLASGATAMDEGNRSLARLSRRRHMVAIRGDGLFDGRLQNAIR